MHCAPLFPPDLLKGCGLKRAPEPPTPGPLGPVTSQGQGDPADVMRGRVPGGRSPWIHRVREDVTTGSSSEGKQEVGVRERP